jgi:5,10-methylene-tetrahydrofolate dehydrogenase/methenyl tetrahydrofolate cyclohydrolase
MLGLAVAGLASVMAALAGDIATLTLARVLQGAGCAASMVVSRSMVQDLFTGPERTRVMAYIGMSLGLCPPLATLLGQKGVDATVTLCHTRSGDLGHFTRQADIVVAAVGKPRLITADMVRPGAAVIDVGINRVEGKLVGDVDYGPVSEVAGWISPVPGGVGPMTVAMLMANTLLAAELRLGKR